MASTSSATVKARSATASANSTAILKDQAHPKNPPAVPELVESTASPNKEIITVLAELVEANTQP